MTDSPRVLRILRAQVKAGHEEEWERLTDHEIASNLTGVDGMMGWYAGHPVDEGQRDYVVVSLWRDMEAIRAFAGASGRATPFRDQAHLADEITVELFELE